MKKKSTQKHIPLGDPLSRYSPKRGEPKRSYPDLHDHICRLAREGLLVVVDEPINKDTEMHPLVRWQFRGGIEEKNRKAFLFTQPTDGTGRRFDSAVLVAGLAASRDVYRVGMDMPLAKIGPAWIRALSKPVEPKLVTTAACHEIVIRGKDLDAPGKGLDGLPVPISTPGWDNGPYLTAGHYITRDPETGIQNAGNYRGQIKARRRLGMNPSLEIRPGIYVHWQKYKAMGKPMPCAVVVGAPPAVSYCAVQKMPEHLDEVWVAGALAGSPMNVVKAKTVDLLVPAEAEFVIEGHVSTEELEPEAPFGESHGYVNLQEYNAFMEVTAITRRRQAVLTSFISQVTPSESSTIRRVAMEPVFLNYLQTTLGIRGVMRVSMHEPLTSVIALIAIQFRRDTPKTEIWRALYGAASLHRYAGKWIVAINEDIDPEMSDALFWAMCYRTQPQYRREGARPQGSRPWPQRTARWRGIRRGADRRHVEGRLRADRAAQAGVHGEREAHLGASRARCAQARATVARLRSGLLAGRACRRSGGGDEERLLQDRGEGREVTAPRRRDEYADHKTRQECTWSAGTAI